MDILNLLGFNITGLVLDLTPDTVSDPSKEYVPRRRTSSFIEEKRGYKKEGKDKELPPLYTTCEITKDIFSMLEKYKLKYETLLNIYSIILCQLSTSSYEDEDKKEIKQKMIDNRIQDLQAIGAKLNDDFVIKANSTDMSIFLSLCNELFNNELNRLKEDRDIYYYIKDEILEKHKLFVEKYFEELKKY